MIDITLNNARGGTISAPFSALSVEALTIQGATLDDGTTVALLTLDGVTLAITHTTGNAATLDLNTIQADAATRYETVGSTVDCVLAIGDTDALQALIPATLTRNVLDNVAPPTQMAPTDPTSDELKAVLARINAVLQAANQTAETIAQDARRVDDLVNVELPQAVEEIDSHLDERVRAADTTIERASTDASTALSDAASSASTALDGKVDTASTALDNKLAAAKTVLDGKVSAANGAASAADGSAKAAQKAREDAEAFKGNAAESAKNAATSAEQAEQAKNAIGDVGGRLEAVEVGVAQKVPKISAIMANAFNVSTINLNSSSVRDVIACHFGWIYISQYASAVWYLSPSGEITKLDCSYSGGDYRFVEIGENETHIWLRGRNGDKAPYRIDIVETSATITKLDAFPSPFNDETNRGIGYLTSNGYLVTTKGKILDGATYAEEDTTFDLNGSKSELLKDGDTFYYFDKTAKNMVKMQVGDDGVPTFTRSPVWTSAATDMKFYPIYNNVCVIGRNNFIIGAHATNGSVYSNRPTLEYLNVFARPKMRVGYIATPNDIYLTNGAYTYDNIRLIRVATDVGIEANELVKIQGAGFSEYRISVFLGDGHGNMAFFSGVSYHQGNTLKVVIFKVKEV